MNNNNLKGYLAPEGKPFYGNDGDNLDIIKSNNELLNEKEQLQVYEILNTKDNNEEYNL